MKRKYLTLPFAINSSTATVSKLVCVSVLSGLLLATVLTTSASAVQATSTPAKTQTDEDPWKVYTPSEARASFQMPSKPRYVQRVITPVQNQPSIKVHLRQSVANEGKITYLFVYNDLNERPTTQKGQDQALDGAIRGSIINVSGKLAKKVDLIKYKSNPGRQFVYRYLQGEKQFVVISRVFLVGRRLYQITFLSLESEFNEALAAKFLNSFKLVKPPSDDPPTPRLTK